MKWIDELKFDGAGLIPVIAQDADTGEVLMLAYANRAALEETLKTGYMTYWSRSRAKLWKKGESSGHVQEVRAIWVDCDKDAVLVKIHQKGDAACHTGRRSCFFHEAGPQGLTAVGEPLFRPEDVYRS